MSPRDPCSLPRDTPHSHRTPFLPCTSLTPLKVPTTKGFPLPRGLCPFPKGPYQQWTPNCSQGTLPIPVSPSLKVLVTEGPLSPPRGPQPMPAHPVSQTPAPTHHDLAGVPMLKVLQHHGLHVLLQLPLLQLRHHGGIDCVPLRSRDDATPACTTACSRPAPRWGCL